MLSSINFVPRTFAFRETKLSNPRIEPHRKMRIGIVTLGCDKNTVDSEYIGGVLEQAGARVLPAGLDPDPGQDLDVVVIQTCGFIDAAKSQSLETILTWLEYKREREAEGRPLKVFLSGCLVQRYQRELPAELDGVDGYLGVGDYDRVVALLQTGPLSGPVNLVREMPATVVAHPTPRKPLSPSRHYAYLKIADGCNHTCAFCAIPSFKGRLRSVPRRILVEEARALIAQGVRELNLVAQDTSDYGKDLEGGRSALPQLLADLAALPGDFWIRLFYFYPGGVTREFLEVMASSPKIVPYLDMPLQHLHPDVLRRMKRPHLSVNVENTIARLRRAIPELTLRTTFIVGFPQETRAEFEYLLNELRRLRFERVGAFEYSDEEGTPAARLEPKVPRRTARARYDRLMRTQAEIAEEVARSQVGKELRVLVESQVDDSTFLARSQMDAPEVDGAVVVRAPHGLRVGEFATVKITGAANYDLFAEA